MSIEMVAPLSQIVDECKAGNVPARSLAVTYAFAIRQEPATADFGPANAAIRERFKTNKDLDGLKALNRIKNLAWGYVAELA